MSYAIISLLGKQWKVSEGDTIIVDRLPHEEGKEFTITDVLLTKKGDDVKVGTPTVSGAKVKLKVESHQKGDKIRVVKYKSKSKYRRVNGHRQHQSTVTVISLS